MSNKIIEFAKCVKSPIYYLNTYGHVFNARESKITPMKCFEYQKNVIRKFHNYRNNIILKSRQCVPGGTCVDTPNGQKAIQDFKIGDEVYSYNLDTKETEIDTIYDAWCSGDKQCVNVVLENKEEIEIGENHPLYIKNVGWVKAKNLKKGDEILNSNNIDSIVKKIEKTEVKKCYDISVDKNENFLINGLLTHNTGLSVVTAGYVAWKLLFSEDERILIIANDGAGAVRFLKTVKQFIEMTPTWLRPDFEVINNQKKIEFSNGSWAEAKASSPDAGRGESLTMLVLDETAFIKDMEDIWMGAGMALSATEGKCIMISTPNGTGSLYHRTWVQGEKANGKNPEDFICSTVHWTENPFSSVGLTTTKDDDGNDIYWSPWYEEQCKRLTWDSVKIAQELDLSFEGSKRLAIDAALVSKYEKRVRNINSKFSIKFDFLYKENPEKFAKISGEPNDCLVWQEPKIGNHYVLAADVARGDGQDYSTIQVIDVESMEQVCEFQGKVGPDLFPHIINHVARWYNEAYVAIEANSFGLGVCFDMRDKFKYSKLHFSKNIKDIHVRSARDFKVGEGVDIPGFQTTRKTRPAIVKAIIEHMREGSLILNSKRLVNEFTTFVMNGEKPEHENGFHDDLIFALGIALYMRDTEYNNVTASKAMFKSMLDAMTFGTSSSVGEIKEKPEHIKKQEEAKKVDLPPGIGGILFDIGNGSTDDDNDDSWLMGPIKG